MRTRDKVRRALRNFRRGFAQAPSPDHHAITNEKSKAMRCPNILLLPLSISNAIIPATVSERQGFPEAAQAYGVEHRAFASLLAREERRCQRQLPLRLEADFLLLDVTETDLQSYVRDQTSPEPGSTSFLWMITQMLGLASALQYFEATETSDQLEERGCPVPSKDLCTHHTALHPTNILLISNEASCEQGDFKIADFSTSVVPDREENAQLRHVKKLHSAELHDCPSISTSRHIFSLGCIFLEVLLWLLDQCDERKEHKPRLNSTIFTGEPFASAWVWTNYSSATSWTPSTRAKLAWLEQKAGTNHDLRALVNICACMLSTNPVERPTAANVERWLGQVHIYMNIRINCFDNIPRPTHSRHGSTYNNILASQRITNLDEETDEDDYETDTAARVVSAIRYTTTELTTSDNKEDTTQVSDPRFDPLRDASIRFVELLNSSQPSLYLKSVPYDPFFAARPD